MLIVANAADIPAAIELKLNPAINVCKLANATPILAAIPKLAASAANIPALNIAICAVMKLQLAKANATPTTATAKPASAAPIPTIPCIIAGFCAAHCAKLLNNGVTASAAERTAGVSAAPTDSCTPSHADSKIFNAPAVLSIIVPATCFEYPSAFRSASTYCKNCSGP